VDRQTRDHERQAAAGDSEAAERIRLAALDQAVREHFDQLDVPCGDGGFSHRLETPRPLTLRERHETPYAEVPYAEVLLNFHWVSDCLDCRELFPFHWVKQRHPDLLGFPRVGDVLTTPGRF
jgi:hypothetical protein